MNFSVFLSRYFLVEILEESSVILRYASLSKETLHEKLTKSSIRKPLMKSNAAFKTVLLQKGKTDFSVSLRQ